MKITRYRIPCSGSTAPRRIAVAADIHDGNPDPILRALREEAPDCILIPGDLTDHAGLCDPQNRAYRFLRECAALAPTFYSIGNHENGCFHKGNPFRKPKKIPLPPEVSENVRATGAVLLDNSCVRFGEWTICGLSSGLDGKNKEPDLSAIAAFDASPGIRILLCHHPEYYVPYLKETGIELTVCGHAHGGHWRLFGHGIYAPGQGLFPRYTSGLLDGGRCVISRGLGNHTHIPRICNEPELLLITFGGETKPSRT